MKPLIKKVLYRFPVTVLLAGVFLGMGANVCLAAQYGIVDNETGGDCGSIGTWDQSSKTCQINTDVVGGITILSNGITIDGGGHNLTGTEAYGIYVESYSGATIQNLHIDGFSYGIFLAFSGSNRILNNTITNASEEGIGIWGSFSTEVAGNTISYSGWDGIGVVLSSARITIHDNIIRDNTWGIWFASSGSGNLVYNNNFINNMYNVDGYDADPVTLNLPAWDGGNYWSDWTGPDADGDGVVDQPYMTTMGQDDLPWVQETGWIVYDNAPPVIDAVMPSGNVETDSAVIAVYYSDAESGIYTPSVIVTLDGSSMSGCSVNSASAVCSAYGLANGAHVIGGSVSDKNANNAVISGSFTVTQAPPPPSGGAVLPHGGYGTSNAPVDKRTDVCLSCHDIHQAAGDYALMREATVTEACGTCHGLFGVAPDGTWTETPIDLPDGGTGEATVSPTAAYENSGASRESGHRLGAASDQYNANVSDAIPGSTLTLRVMDSAAYDEGDIYTGESVLAYGATAGLYCASCHTPHGSVGGTDTDGDGETDSPIPVNNYNSSGVVISQAYFGDQLVIDDDGSHPKDVSAFKLISSNPNHMAQRHLYQEEYAGLDEYGTPDQCDVDTDAIMVPGDDGLINNDLCDKFMQVDPAEKAISYNDWCLTCHDKQWNGTDWESTVTHGVPEGGNNHPPLCVSCHSRNGGNKGVKDFPHTSGNVKLLSKDHDGICLGCHGSGRLP